MIISIDAKKRNIHKVQHHSWLKKNKNKTLFNPEIEKPTVKNVLNVEEQDAFP